MTRSRSTLAVAEADQARLAEVHRLARLGAAGLEALSSMLSDSSWPVRREVVAALAQLGEVSIGPLCDSLKADRGSEARVAAVVDTLVQNRADPLPQLTELAQHADPAVAADAAQILGRRRSSRAIPILIPLVTHTDDNVAVAAIEALGRIGGPSAVETLIEAVGCGNFFRVFPAIDVLGRSADPRAIAPLAALLPNPMYQLEAARALGKTAQAAAVGPLVGLLSHPSERTVRVAAVVLVELHVRHRERYGSDEAPAAVLRQAAVGPAVVQRLVRSLTNAAPEEQQAVAFILGVIGGEQAAAGLSGLLDTPGATGEAVAAALERLGKDSDLHIAEALRHGGSARRQMLLPVVARSSIAEDVAECLTDPDPRVRSLACEALARTGAVEQVGRLFEVLSDAKPGVVQSAIGAIQSLGSSETKRLALETAQADDPALRRSGLRILGYFGFPEALPVFLQALASSDVRIIDAALAGLAYLPQLEAIEALLGAARAPSERTRQASMRALGQTPKSDPRVSACLLEGFADSDAWVRYYACQSAGKLALTEATHAIIRLLADPAGQVRVAAVEALSGLGNAGALEALSRVAAGDDPDLQRAALIGLGMAKHPEGIERLRAAVASPDAVTRLVAISALTESGAPDRVSVLERAARDPDENVRAAAIGCLAGLPEPQATIVLLELLKEAADPSRIVTLLTRPTEGRVAGAVTRLAVADDEMSSQLCSLLARIRTPEATRALFQALAQGHLPARKAAAAALASLHTPEAFAAVKRAAAEDRDAGVRQICSILLRQ